MRFIVPLVLALGCATATAQLYTWKDADGKVHYSDEPPPGKTPARKVAPPPPPANPPAAAAKAAGDKDKDKKPDEAASKVDKEKAEAEVRQANCERARGNLKALESGTVRFTVNAKGERVALEGAVLQAELEAARKGVEGWCK